MLNKQIHPKKYCVVMVSLNGNRNRNQDIQIVIIQKYCELKQEQMN